jgi:hypothetical protein
MESRLPIQPFVQQEDLALPQILAHVPILHGQVLNAAFQFVMEFHPILLQLVPSMVLVLVLILVLASILHGLVLNVKTQYVLEFHPIHQLFAPMQVIVLLHKLVNAKTHHLSEINVNIQSASESLQMLPLLCVQEMEHA